MWSSSEITSSELEIIAGCGSTRHDAGCGYVLGEGFSV